MRDRCAVRMAITLGLFLRLSVIVRNSLTYTLFLDHPPSTAVVAGTVKTVLIHLVGQVSWLDRSIGGPLVGGARSGRFPRLGKLRTGGVAVAQLAHQVGTPIIRHLTGGIHVGGTAPIGPLIGCSVPCHLIGSDAHLILEKITIVRILEGGPADGEIAVTQREGEKVKIDRFGTPGILAKNLKLDGTGIGSPVLLDIP